MMTDSKTYDRIASNIKLFWGTAYLREYVVHVLNDVRDGNRQGFPPTISKLLLDSLREHDEQYPELGEVNEHDTQRR